MYVVCVTVFVKEGYEQRFVEASEANHLGTRQEPGNLRFDVLRAEGEKNRFFLYEVYRSADDFRAHQQTEHYLKWKQTVADWMAKPRQGVKHHSLLPIDQEF